MRGSFMQDCTTCGAVLGRECRPLKFKHRRSSCVRWVEEDGRPLPGRYEWVTEVEDGTDEVSDEVLAVRLGAVQSVQRELARRGDEPR